MSNTKTVTFPEAQFNTLLNLFQLMAVAGLKLYGTGSAIPTDNQIEALWYTLRDAALAPERVDRAGSGRLCVDCGESIHNGVINYCYMVFDAIWRGAGYGIYEISHIKCLEQRLGRRLKKEDFTDCPMNQLIHWILDQGLELPKD